MAEWSPTEALASGYQYTGYGQGLRHLAGPYKYNNISVADLLSVSVIEPVFCLHILSQAFSIIPMLYKFILIFFFKLDNIKKGDLKLWLIVVDN